MTRTWSTRGAIPVIARFCRDESGSATIESLLWILMFFALLGLVTDASLAFFGRAEAFRIVQDGNRAYSIHAAGFDSPADVESYVRGQLAQQAPNATVRSAVQPNGMILTQVTIPLSDLTLFSNFEDASIGVQGGHYVE